MLIEQHKNPTFEQILMHLNNFFSSFQHTDSVLHNVVNLASFLKTDALSKNSKQISEPNREYRCPSVVSTCYCWRENRGRLVGNTSCALLLNYLRFEIENYRRKKLRWTSTFSKSREWPSSNRHPSTENQEPNIIDIYGWSGSIRQFAKL